MELLRNGRPRVVITGMGALTSLGQAPELWERLKNGQSGIRRIHSFDPQGLTVQIAGEVDFNPNDYLDHKDARRMARSSQLAQVAARLAAQDSGIAHQQLAEEGDRVGVVIGTGQGGYEVAAKSNIQFAHDHKEPNPLALVHALPNMPAHHVSRELHATGPSMTVITACASGTQAIGEGAEFIRTGRTDVVFAGGVEGMIQDYVIAALNAMTVLATGYNDNPQAASRPFDLQRNGFVYGEGAAILALESLEHASQRSARIYAEVLGHGASSDAFHITSPDADGRGAQKAMQWALDDARVGISEVDYINAHGTGTKSNDAMETNAIKRVFGQAAYRIPISSTKSMTGHCLGASGAIEAVACVMSLREGVIHPTINYDTPDPECDLDYVPNTAREKKISTGLSNGFGFGGQNACLLLGKF